MSASTALPEAVALAHALVERLAREAGIRVLFIKGPVLEQQSLRSGHQSIDCDVFVDPDKADDLGAALGKLGWRRRVPSTSAHILAQHSTTYVNDFWPCEIDVHHTFPGFFAEPSEVFEALWRRRTTFEVADRILPSTDVIGSAAIAGLHALRDPSLVRSRNELAQLVEALSGQLDELDRLELTFLVEETGAADTLRPLLDAVAAPVPTKGHASVEELEAWLVRTASTGVKTVPWVVELRRTPWHRRPARLWHALVLTEAEIREYQPNVAPGAKGLLVARLRRVGRGLHDLPTAIRLIRENSAPRTESRRGVRRVPQAGF